MTTYSTCPDCGRAMLIFKENSLAHPLCREPEDYYWHAVKEFEQSAYDGNNEAADKWAKLIEEMDDAPPRLGESALIYASWGWPVFPCLPGQKIPATPHGFKDATTSKETVVRWWKDTPNYNIGIATGHAFDVIDVDPPEGLLPWVRLADSGRLPATHGWSNTPSGGWHVFLEPSGGAGNLTALGGVVSGMDYRGKGGYVVVPPSVSAEESGRRYRWSVKPSPNVVYRN